MTSLHNYSNSLKEEYPIERVPFIENMWGHRFRIEQTPAILFFELLCIVENQYQAKRAGLIKSIFDVDNNELFFKHRRAFKLRLLIYQNEMLETVFRSSLSDEEKWMKQIEWLTSIESDYLKFTNEDVAHLRGNFKSFESFYTAIKILNSLTFDPLTKKRWTSKFVYPISIECIWADVHNDKLTEDRRFFGRGGELLYLMLCRADKDCREKLEKLFVEWLEDTGSSYSKLINLMITDEDRVRTDKKVKLGFLPYTNLPLFNNFASDIANILTLPLDKLDKVKVIIDFTGYHVGHYVLTIGETYHNERNPNKIRQPFYIAEVLTKTTNSIRKASIQSLSNQRNKLKRSFETRHLDIAHLYDDDTLEATERESQLKTNKDAGLAYLNSQILPYANMCFRAIGLQSKRNTRSHRYVLTEEFLHSLVVVIVGNEKRMEFNKFLNVIRENYAIYVERSPNSDFALLQRDLNRNAKNLATLLYQMGMLRHLSDACSYVINPYREDSV